MKKNIIFASIGALIADVVGLLINLICIYTMETMPLAITIVGGECIDHVGFGLLYEEIFSYSTFDTGGVSKHIMFYGVNFLTTFVVIFIILLILKIIINKVKSKKQ